MAKRLTYKQVKEFVNLYTETGMSACCEKFVMTPAEAAREAALLNIQEPHEFSQKEKDAITRYQPSLGTATYFVLVDRRPKDFLRARA